ncbi:hypothetical protein EV175_001724 [Coemansia sp. RSA 1933]|nr:hypothetical protein EV175_001724 [Coemansia sp. RSA 1933]
MGVIDLARRDTTLDPATRATFLGTMLNVTVDPVGTPDKIVIIVGGAVYGFTALIIAYAWLNIKYRPIRAKNMTWTTLIHIAGILWFVGDLPTNGLVELKGPWIICKLWIIWFRILFCYIYALMHMVRFFALDRVFNQNKPFRGMTNVYALVVVLVTCVLFAVISQVLPSDMTVTTTKDLELCNVVMHYRIAAVVIQWVMWAGVAVLIFRLRNIQSSFNEFRESVAIFLVAICILTESSVTLLGFEYYPLLRKHRLEKTLMDCLGSNIMVWLIIAQPVYNCIFNRRAFEALWLEKLTRDGRKSAYEVSSGQGGTTAYHKMGERDTSMMQSSHINFGSSEAIHTLSAAVNGHQNYYDISALSPDGNTLTSPEAAAFATNNNNHNHSNNDGIPLALRNNLQIRRPVLNTPTMFNVGFADTHPEERRIL